MTNLREAAQMALDALEFETDYDTAITLQKAAIEMLRAALAQPEPEPLPAKSKGALSHDENKQHNKKILDKFYEENAHLYTAPPQREWHGLTAGEIKILRRAATNDREFADLISAKLKEKNGG